MNKLSSLSIKVQLFVMVFIMAFFTAGIIIYSGVSFRNEKIREALKDSSMLADSLSNEHKKMVSDIQQLMLTLSELSELDAEGMQPVLQKVLSVNPKYSNMFIADRSGRMLASAVPARDTNVSDRSYFKKALATGRFSSGQYTISRFTGKSVFHGVIDVKSKVGEGTIFFVYLPAVETVEMSTGPVFKDVRSFRKGRVLLMDDEDIVRNIAGDMLRSLGHEVELAADGSTYFFAPFRLSNFRFSQF